jgi:hypothetical protein
MDHQVEQLHARVERCGNILLQKLAHRIVTQFVMLHMVTRITGHTHHRSSKKAILPGVHGFKRSSRQVGWIGAIFSALWGLFFGCVLCVHAVMRFTKIAPPLRKAWGPDKTLKRRRYAGLKGRGHELPSNEPG